MRMESNPTRQWFVYDKEREQGPFNEAELSQKIKSQEFGFEAYVYTEGMSDWALIKDTPVLLESVSAPNVEASLESLAPSEKIPEPQENIAPISQSTNESTVSEASETKSPELTIAEIENLQKQSQEKLTKKKSSLGIIKILVGALAVAALFFAFYDNRAVLQKNLQSDDAESNSNTEDQSEIKKGPSSDWEKLRNFRLESTVQGPSFMLNSDKFSGDFPIIHGALSPLLPYDTIKAALFPDTTKTIMPVPFVHLFKVAVQDGFFVVGPLQNKAQNLTPGRYRLLLAFEGNFLGEASFEIEHWPTQPRLIEIEKTLFSERRELAQKEKDSLNKKYSEIGQALEQIKSIDTQMEKAAKTKAVWAEKADLWENTLNKATQDQEKTLSGPMFYPVLQQAIYQLLQDISSLASSYKDKHLGLNKKALSQKTVTELLTRIQNNQNEFQKAFQSSTIENESLSIQIDKDIVKKQLLETW